MSIDLESATTPGREVEVGRLFAAMARELGEMDDVRAARQHIVDRAIGLLGCEWAALAEWRSDREHLSFVGGRVEPVVHELAAISRSCDQGIVSTAFTQRATVVSNDIGSDARWPAYGAAVVTRTPVRSGAAVLLHLAGEVLGVLGLYAGRPGFFTPGCLDMAGIYADHAALALSRVQEFTAARNLRLALDSNRQIGVAVGVLMARYRLTESQAYEMLKATSQQRHRKMRELAEDVVLIGDLPS